LIKNVNLIILLFMLSWINALCNIGKVVANDIQSYI
jgi:hypothetical protein